MTRVWIAYEPLVITEALIKLVSLLDGVEIVTDTSQGVDIGIFRLSETGQLQHFFRPQPLPNAKLVVFSPRGERAFIRQAGEKEWAEVRPFGVPQLLAEIRAGRGVRVEPG